MSIRTAIIGATGYTGSELVRLLSQHPEVEIVAITSESHQGKAFSDIHGQFSGIVDQPLIPASELNDFNPDAVFLALPHGVSMNYVQRLAGDGYRIIDLSGDFRLASTASYKHWYQKDHTFPEGLEQAVYGLPELHREAIRDSWLVANPGCYPTSAILGTAPLLKAGLIEPTSIIVDAKSGVTGAGIKAKPTTHYSNVSDNFKAYGLKTHRHTIEIEQQLSAIGAGSTTVQFTPHLLPVDRGILATIYMHPTGAVTETLLQEVYADFYRNEPFIRVRTTPPTLKDVRGSNFCDLYTTFDQRTGRIITIAVIDNLVKGAAGQAVHNMNLMFGLEETCGFPMVPLNP